MSDSGGMCGLQEGGGLSWGREHLSRANATFIFYKQSRQPEAYTDTYLSRVMLKHASLHEKKEEEIAGMYLRKRNGAYMFQWNMVEQAHTDKCISTLAISICGQNRSDRKCNVF